MTIRRMLAGLMPDARPEWMPAANWDILQRYVIHGEEPAAIAAARGQLPRHVEAVIRFAPWHFEERLPGWRPPQDCFSALPYWAAKALFLAGYRSPEEVAAATDLELLRARGIQERALAIIRAAYPHQPTPILAHAEPRRAPRRTRTMRLTRMRGSVD